MRRIIQWTLIPAAMVAVGCSKGHSRAPTAMADDLKRDLQLASTTQNIQISPDEVAPQSKQELAVRPKRAPNGHKVIRTEHPTIKASAKPAEVAEIKTNVPQVEVMASSPAPSETPTPDAPPMARPAPMPTQGSPGAQPVPRNGGDGGIGSVLGGIFGGVIRGGVMGGDDHCDPRGGRRGGRPIGGDIMGGMGGVYGRPGGMGGRFPIIR